MNSITYALYDSAEKMGLLSVLEPFGEDLRVKIPLSQTLCKREVTELMLSVRSINGLMRSGTDTVDKLTDVIMSEDGLAGVRNLGKKSIGEIKTTLLVLAYDELTVSEKQEFWRDFLEENGFSQILDHGGEGNA